MSVKEDLEELLRLQILGVHPITVGSVELEYLLQLLLGLMQVFLSTRHLLLEGGSVVT